MRNLLKIIATFTMLGFFSNANAEGYCNDGIIAEEDANGVITFKGSQEGANCSFAPDEYTVKIYKMALCTTAPTRPTTTDTYDVSSCVDIINSPDGQDVNLAAGSEMILSDATRPADGTYPYGYILMANTFGIKAKKQFTNTMKTYQDGTAGNYCWTKDATAYTSDSNVEDGGWTDPTPLAQCGGAGGTAGTYTEILDAFDTDEYITGPISVLGGDITADLITDANGLVVTATQTADRLFAIQTFIPIEPVVIAPSSTEFTVSFGVNQAASLWYYEQPVGSSEYQVYAIGSGPFSTYMSAN